KSSPYLATYSHNYSHTFYSHTFYSHTFGKGFFLPRSIKRDLVDYAVCRRQVGHDSARLRSYYGPALAERITTV
ncbi:MAG: hypothetical protein WA412_18010, partial [Candidatus Sulfotelmatobacter sp.]